MTQTNSFVSASALDVLCQAATCSSSPARDLFLRIPDTRRDGALMFTQGEFTLSGYFRTELLTRTILETLS